MCLLQIPTVLHMFSLVRVFLKITLKTSLKVLLYILERICDSNEKFEKHSAEYQNYFIARDYRSGKVKELFSDIKTITREEARKPKLHKATLST